MADCAHLNFNCQAAIGRLTKVEGGPVVSFTAGIKICCADCGRQFQFLGLEPGDDTQGARMSIDGLEARLAICPQGEHPSPLDRVAVNFRMSTGPSERDH